jgi:hypothetical protein
MSVALMVEPKEVDKDVEMLPALRIWTFTRRYTLEKRIRDIKFYDKADIVEDDFARIIKNTASSLSRGSASKCIKINA